MWRLGLLLSFSCKWQAAGRQAGKEGNGERSLHLYLEHLYIYAHWSFIVSSKHLHIENQWGACLSSLEAGRVVCKELGNLPNVVSPWWLPEFRNLSNVSSAGEIPTT